MQDTPNRRPAGASSLMNAMLDGLPLYSEKDLQEYGERVAIESARIEPDPPTLDALVSEARSMARRNLTKAYDPENDSSDRLFRQKYDDSYARRSLLQERVDAAAIVVRDAERERSRHGQVGHRPEPNYVAVLVSLLAIAFSVGVAVHDAIFAALFADPRQAVVSSMLAGAILGGLPTLGMIWTALHAERAQVWEEWAWFTLGIVFGLAVLALRLPAAEGESAVILAWGLAGLEIVTVLVTKLYARSLHRDVVAWVERKAKCDPADAAIEAAKSEQARLREEAEGLDRWMEAHRRRAEVASTVRALMPEIEEGAVRAISAGYHRGITRNRAHYVGMRPPVA